MDTDLQLDFDGEAEDLDWGEQLFAASEEFADNPEPRFPVVLLLDRSSSMAGAPLDALHAGLRAFADGLRNGPLARQRVEVAVVAFGGSVEVVQDFVTADRFPLPVLVPQGLTPLGTGLLKALELIEARKARYRAHAISYSRPWLVVLTDGMPQGEPWGVVRQAVRRVREAEAARAVAVLAVGVEGANLRFLARLAQRPPLALPDLRFDELFTWLSASAGRAALSPADGQLPLPPPDWAAPGAEGAWQP